MRPRKLRRWTCLLVLLLSLHDSTSLLPQRGLLSHHQQNQLGAQQQPQQQPQRRSFLGSLLLPLQLVVATTPPALAEGNNFAIPAEKKRNPLNPLTSRPLEALRILEQEERNEQYGGELASPSLGASGGSNVGVANTPGLLLVPIARIEAVLKDIRNHGYYDDPGRWDEARMVISTRVLPKTDFKKAFNNFADNIYYSAADADRANAYLGGGATPTTTQTTQYMLRNEVLSNVEMAEQELTYLIGIRDATGDKKVSGAELTSTETLEDITDFLDKALAALDSYLKIPVAEDVARARKAVQS
jgi:hypothetical protein